MLYISHMVAWLTLSGMCVVMLILFFFKQKTAYEMRISDWSSDVCSSDLGRCLAPRRPGGGGGARNPPARRKRGAVDFERVRRQIGRASCRERVCQYV